MPLRVVVALYQFRNDKRRYIHSYILRSNAVLLDGFVVVAVTNFWLLPSISISSGNGNQYNVSKWVVLVYVLVFSSHTGQRYHNCQVYPVHVVLSNMIEQAPEVYTYLQLFLGSIATFFKITSNINKVYTKYYVLYCG